MHKRFYLGSAQVKAFSGADISNNGSFFFCVFIRYRKIYFAIFVNGN